MHINSKWFIRSDANIYTQIKLVSVDQKRVCHVFAYDRRLFNVNVINIIDEIYTFSLATICWFYDPNVFFAFMLLQFLIVVVEVTELVWKNVSIRS